MMRNMVQINWRPMVRRMPEHVPWEPSRTCMKAITTMTFLDLSMIFYLALLISKYSYEKQMQKCKHMDFIKRND